MDIKSGAKNGFAGLESLVTDFGGPTAPVAPDAKQSQPIRSERAPATSGTPARSDAESTYLELPTAFGEFGRVASNPIPLASSKLAMFAYIGSLRADDGKFGRRVTWRELGATSCPQVTTHPILRCQVTPFTEPGQPDVPAVDLFLVLQFKYNTTKLPTGFQYFNTQVDRGRNTVCMKCGAIIEIIPATFHGCPNCGLRQGGSEMQNHRYFASLAAFSDIHWSNAQMLAIGQTILRTGEPPPAAKKLLNTYFTEIVAKENRDKFQMPIGRIHMSG